LSVTALRRCRSMIETVMRTDWSETGAMIHRRLRNHTPRFEANMWFVPVSCRERVATAALCRDNLQTGRNRELKPFIHNHLRPHGVMLGGRPADSLFLQIDLDA
jgi:hypothetical protein